MEYLIKQYVAAYNAKDVDGMLALLHNVVVFEHVARGHVSQATSGKAEFETLARQSVSMFQTRTQTIRSLTLGERTAAAEIDFEGTLATDLPDGSQRAGDTLRVRGVTVFAFSDGKIARISDYS